MMQRALQSPVPKSVCQMITRSLVVNKEATAMNAEREMHGQRLRGKVEIVTAATDGIGFAIAKRLAEEGAQVAICSRKQKNVDNAMRRMEEYGFEDNVMAMKCHVTDADQRQLFVEKTVEKFGGIDGLVHCAGISPNPGKVLDCTSESFDKIMEVNLKSALEFTRAVRPYMNERKGGSIVFLSSIASYETTAIELGMYSVSKLALNGLTRAIAKNLVDENIRVNCLVAGLVNTKYAGAVLNNEENRKIAENDIPMKRVAEPREMGGMVAFLLSEDASYMTGENVVLAGGCPSRI